MKPKTKIIMGVLLLTILLVGFGAGFAYAQTTRDIVDYKGKDNQIERFILHDRDGLEYYCIVDNIPLINRAVLACDPTGR